MSFSKHETVLDCVHGEEYSRMKKQATLNEKAKQDTSEEEKMQLAEGPTQVEGSKARGAEAGTR